MLFSTHKDERTEREQYLEDELDRYQKAEEEQRDREWRAREQRREEARAHAEWEERQADNWKEALTKQIRLCQRERRNELKDCKQYGGEPKPEETNCFVQTAKACERALEIYTEVEHRRQPEIDALLKQIEDIKNSIRGECADQLEKEGTTDGWNNVVTVLRSDDEPSAWLQW